MARFAALAIAGMLAILSSVEAMRMHRESKRGVATRGERLTTRDPDGSEDDDNAILLWCIAEDLKIWLSEQDKEESPETTQLGACLGAGAFSGMELKELPDFNEEKIMAFFKKQVEGNLWETMPDVAWGDDPGNVPEEVMEFYASKVHSVLKDIDSFESAEEAQGELFRMYVDFVL